VRLGEKDEILLQRLEEKTGKSRNALLVEALRHLYWTVLVKDQGVWSYLPSDLRGKAAAADESGGVRHRVAR
jgi:hypothetical protein